MLRRQVDPSRGACSFHRESCSVAAELQPKICASALSSLRAIDSCRRRDADTVPRENIRKTSLGNQKDCSNCTARNAGSTHFLPPAPFQLPAFPPSCPPALISTFLPSCLEF